MPMKNLYTLVFTSNNTNIEENFVLDLSKMDKEEQIVKEALNHMVFSPRQKVLDNLFKLIRNGEI